MTIRDKSKYLPTSGFKLVEAIFAIVLLGIMVVSITGVYIATREALKTEVDLKPEAALKVRLSDTHSGHMAGDASSGTKPASPGTMSEAGNRIYERSSHLY